MSSHLATSPVYHSLHSVSASVAVAGNGIVGMVVVVGSVVVVVGSVVVVVGSVVVVVGSVVVVGTGVVAIVVVVGSGVVAIVVVVAANKNPIQAHLNENNC